MDPKELHFVAEAASQEPSAMVTSPPAPSPVPPHTPLPHLTTMLFSSKDTNSPTSTFYIELMWITLTKTHRKKLNTNVSVIWVHSSYKRFYFHNIFIIWNFMNPKHTHFPVLQGLVPPPLKPPTWQKWSGRKEWGGGKGGAETDEEEEEERKKEVGRKFRLCCPWSNSGEQPLRDNWVLVTLKQCDKGAEV